MNPRRRLFYKYVVPIIAIVVLALAASGGIGIYFSYKETRSALLLLQREKAAAAAARMEQFVREIERRIGWAALPQLLEGGDPLELRRLEYANLAKQVQAITEACYIDERGREQVCYHRLRIDALGSGGDLSQDPRFVVARGGKTYFGPVYYRKETEPYMALAMRAGREGVTAVEVNLKFIWEVVQQIKVGKTGYAYVVSKDGHLLAHPDISLVLQKTDFSGLPQVKAALANPEASAEEQLAIGARDLSGRRVLTAFARIEPLEWTVFVQQPLAEAYASLYAPLLQIGLLLLLGLAMAVIASLALARYMVRPINALRAGAQAIGAGNLEQHIDVRTGDELQELAEQFNAMTGKLRESYAGLESKVEARTAELQEALEHQKATAEILRAISGSMTETQPVFEAIVRNCHALFPGSRVALGLAHDGRIEVRASVGATGAADTYELAMDRESGLATCIMEARTLHLPDLAAAAEEYPRLRQAGLARGYRSGVFTPLLREGSPIGALSVLRPAQGAFGEKELALLKTFADQAVIAIENARLFNETRESLEQQKASAEVLAVISSSIADTAPVFDKILERCERLFAGKQVGINLVGDDGQIRIGAYHGPGRAALERVQPFPRGDGSGSGAAIAYGRVMHYPDAQDGPDVPETTRRGCKAIGVKAAIFAPMLWEGRGIGVIFVGRDFAGPFSDKEVALLKTFADQAAIAIQNVRLFREIQEKSAQLEIANKHKSDFLANMSHELRTPLNAIIGFSEVLIEKMFGEVNDKQLDYLKDIHSSGRHLLSLINDILDLSKIEAGRMELELSDFDLPAALQNAMTLVRERAQRHGISLGLEIAPGLGALRADERKFKQIMLNLLSNAVKFTPEGGSVRVAAKANGTMVEISVADSGVGIAAEDHEAVFEEFKQVGRDYSRKAEGTGLGLALTRRFVELHSGEIRLASAPGKGSTFTFTLPVHP
jgi:signal transduction histidine kinase